MNTNGFITFVRLFVSRPLTRVATSLHEVDKMDAYSINPITNKKEEGVLTTINSIDDLARDAPRMPARRSYGGIRAGIAALTAAAVYLGSAMHVRAAPWQWGPDAPEVSQIGSASMDGTQLIYLATIQNYGDSDADNMLNQTISTQNGQDFNYSQIFVRPDTVSPWQLVASTPGSPSTSVNLNYFVASGDKYMLKIVMQTGENPGMLTLSAISEANGDFNNLTVIPESTTIALGLAGLAAMALKFGRKVKHGLNSVIDSVH